MSLYPTLPDDFPAFRHAKLTDQPHSLLPTCSVCYDEFSEMRIPRYLLCHHTFCEECIHQMIKCDKVECPLCRKVCRVTSVNLLQTNNDVLTMAKYGNLFVNLWCHDCQDTPKATCMTHRVDNQSPTSEPTLGQQVDNTVEAWTPTVMRMVETTQGWAVVAMDATYATITSVSEYVAPLTTYISEWFNSLLQDDDP
ncbi:uncharacterized protein LOC121875554 [Homarus americanus]|uniref:E3 ubiquitin-protein ligase TRIM32-like 1 n=1 Tax=Homarus americanus TaxID=6706 RepID=A0A8J5JX63_HOMAM|nr:uncharacterized protein LOC121875554 [Homarus americanus]XP_042236069.1 uncharacterized protein LOC121875554 [Homarus americanus]XP_042236070.1 uncharacterized protein LOC121875554 [Homarus americanus]XP_042236071.1 uncharacterized protein LOC121875554 [Homarus americanus]KAG7161034.1 E3 ubiquitin-protein ligase TRIM32-like 1 [Homarus americanus]